MAGAKPGVHVVQLKPINVPETLVKGNKFIKWEENSTSGTPVTLKVDPKGYILYWKDQNKEMDYLDLSLIRDTRTGKYAKVPKEGKLKDNCMIGQPDVPVEDKTVTIAYGTNMTNISFINFVCSSRETAKLWCDELLLYAYNLLAANGNVLTFLEKAHTRITHVLDINGRIPVKSIVKMFATHRDDKKRVEKALESINIQSGKHETIDPNTFTFDMFFHFYRQLVGRTEVDKVFDESGAKKKPYLTVDQFWHFLNKEQRDPRLNEILYPHCTITMAQEYINIYETKLGMAEKGHMSQEGFLKFLMGEENNVVAPELLDLSHEMVQPLAHYFINSSHNTYLTGHQITGKSSVEMYRQVLLSGCRCIELDCWDGRNADEEPIITHGYTMCTEVYFKEVIEAIAESAFKTSEYPVILSFENHCSQKQQAKMAAHLRNIFGDLLLTEPLPNFALDLDTPSPPPSQLMRKIIVKNKKKHFHAKPKQVKKQNSSSVAEESEGKQRTQSISPENSVDQDPENNNDVPVEEESDSDASDYESDGDGEKADKIVQYQKEKGTAGTEAEAGLEMSELVNYIQPVHFHSFETSEKRKKSYEISSFVETQATSLLKENPVEFVNYNKRQLSRIYPRGTRVDSSNFLPQIFWNAGCQMVALNFQTLDLPMQLNQGIFEYNNRSGYILKPDFMRRTDRRFDPFAESTVDGIVAGTVSIKVISGQMLSDKKINTFVEVDMYGLPTDTVRKKWKTRTVMSNGINPVYDEEAFVFKKVVLPNLAIIRIAVFEDNGKMVGHRVLPVQGLRPGYRHIPLRNEFNLPLLLPTLFVHIGVKDYVPDEMEMLAAALINPIAYLSELDKHSKQLEILELEELSDDEDNAPTTNGTSSPAKTPTSPTRKEIPKRPSDQHIQVRTSLSMNSDGSSGREQILIHPVTSINSENGSIQFNYISKCKLNGLPLSEMQKQGSVQFVGATEKADIMDIAAIVNEDIKKMQPDGIESFDAMSKARCVVKSCVDIIVADYAMLSYCCNHLGAASTKYCPKCYADSDHFMTIAQNRTPRETQLQIQRINLRSSEKDKKKLRKKKGVKEHRNVIWDILDPHKDIPVGMLHLIPLGLAKHLVKFIVNHCNESLVRKMDIHLQYVCPESRFQNFFKYIDSRQGKDFKDYLQVATFNMLFADVPRPLVKMVACLASIQKLLNRSAYTDQNIEDIRELIRDYHQLVYEYAPELRKKAKTHLLLHIVEDIQRHGPPKAFAEDAFEKNHGAIRNMIFLQNQKARNPSLVTPTSLEKLKTLKPYIKITAKRDKELETLNRKHEKARENMKEIHELQEERLMISQVKAKDQMEKSHAKLVKKALRKGSNVEEVESNNRLQYSKLVQEHNYKRKNKHKELKQTQGELFVDMCKDQFKAELDIYMKYHIPCYDALKMLLDINHKNHMQQIQETFEMDSEDLKKEMETKSKLEMKNLAKNFKDKNELGRRKREAQTKHVTMVVNEIEKLKEIQKQKEGELAPILAKVKQELEREREERAKYYQDQFDEKCRRLTEQFRDVGLAKETENTPL